MAASVAPAPVSTKTSIPRKPYKIYRRFEDVADFADQFEEEFPRLVAATAAAAATSASTSASVVPGSATATTAAAATRAVSHSQGPKSTSVKRSSVLSPNSFSAFGNSSRVHDNVSTIALRSSTLKEKRLTATSVSALHNSPASVAMASNSNALSSSVVPPRLKSGLVLFVTKAVCLQRKGEIDRYLQELFALGSIVTQSRLVAEFFGIWKTDMEIHLRQEDRDPLALNTLSNTTTSAVTTTVIIQPEGNKETEEKDEKEDTEKEVEEKNMLHAIVEEINASTALLPLMHKDHHSPLTAPCSPTSHSAPENDEANISRSDSTSTASSCSTPATPQYQSVNTTMMVAQPLSYLASPALSPNPKTDFPRPPSRWTYELPGQLYESTRQLESAPTAEIDMDSEMASPVETKVLMVLEKQDVTQISPDEVAQVSTTTMTTTSTTTTTTTTTSNATEPESVIDITTRTIKKFKSLRRTNISSHPQIQTQDTRSQLDAQNQDDLPPTPSSKVGPSSATATASNASSVSTLRASSSTQAQVQATATTTATTSTTTKSKIMKRSKTIVFRPEVTMQPLSSKNVIPPWNRIPSVTGNATGTTSPISPASPKTPGGANTQLPLVHSPNTVTGESVTVTTPTTLDSEDRPRKLTMSQSKTMSAISSTTASSFSNLSYRGIGASGSGDSSGSSNSSATGTAAAAGTSSSNSSSSPSMSGLRARSMSISSVSSSVSTLIAPWNRVSPHSEANTHLHALVHHNQSSSSSSSTYIPVELGRSFHKKDGNMQKSHTMTTRMGGLEDRRPSVPVLTNPPESRNRTLTMTTGSMSRSFEAADVAVAPALSKSKGAKKSGMTHSVSAPGGFLPTMTISAPETSSSAAANNRSGSSTTSNSNGGSGAGIGASTETVQRKASNPSSIASTKKRSPRRESVMSLHSPSMSTKQPVGILKNANSSANQNRKSSLTVPAGSSMFPVQSAHMMSSSLSSSSSATGSTSSVGLVSAAHSGSSIATTFKIVMDADTIVALQVFEDKSFILTLNELRNRVKSKFVKSNIQLPDKFDLVWVIPSSTSASSSTLNTPVSATAPNLPSSNSIHRLSDPGIVLKTDEELHKAILSSRNRKVTLRCNM
ncbi:hypothetical protein BGX26_001812 [Mortierella sp. AD094]|nr:hypothetical protein BGX26_001812 [Mortierella sp. AD094]